MVHFSITVVPALVNNYLLYLEIHTLWGVGRAVGQKQTKNKNKSPSLSKGYEIS